jgi:hypothetical protein
MLLNIKMKFDELIEKRFLEPIEKNIRKLTSEDIEKYYQYLQYEVLHGKYSEYIKLALYFWFGSYIQLAIYIWNETKILPKEKVIEILRTIWNKSKWSILGLYILLNPIALLSFAITSLFLVILVIIALIVFVLHPIHAKLFSKMLKVPKYDDEH